MSIEYLIVLSYASAITFLMIIAWSIGFVAMLRRLRLQAQPVAINDVKPITWHKRNTIIQDIFRKSPAWRNNRIYAVQEGKPITHNIRPIHDIVTLPSRYQHTLLYGDNLALQQDETETQPAPPVN